MMDAQKNIQRADSVSRLIESQHVRTNPFGENRAGERAYRRAERIAAALHLLTNHISENEGIRRTIRDQAALLLKHMLLLRDEMRAPLGQNISQVQGTIRYVISLVRLLLVSGFISHQNAETMVEALDELGAFITVAQKSHFSESVVLSREELRDPYASYTSPSGVPQRSVRGNAKSDTRKDVKDNERTVVESLGQVSSRAQNILNTLRSGNSLGIREICAHVPEYSEKMVQRELLTLVSLGRVTKTGHKRWSKYALAAQ